MGGLSDGSEYYDEHATLDSKNSGDPEVISEQKLLAVAEEGQIEASRKSPVSEDQGDEGAWGLKNTQGTH